MAFHLGARSILLSMMLVASPAAATPVVLDFNALPSSPWTTNSCDSADMVTVNAGVLTIDTPSCYEFDLVAPLGEWHQKVDNAKGWAVETRLSLDPSSQDNGGSGIVQLWINDHTNLLIVGFTKDHVQLQYPESAGAPVNTTDNFHVYRVVSALDKVRLYVDGALVINHTLTQTGAGSTNLSFGDGDGGGYSRSYWDYFWYDVDCFQGQCDPGATCVDGAPCDDGNACTQGDVCAGGACSGSPVTCVALDECFEAGACNAASGCSQHVKPDGSPCSGGVCVGGACTSNTTTTSVAQAASSAAGTGGAGGASGTGGAGGAVSDGPGITGRATCFCEMGSAPDAPAAWLGLAALLAVGRTRRGSRRAGGVR